MKTKNYSIKNSLKVFLIFAFVSASCSSFAYQQTIRGNGNISEENRSASSFNSISATEGIEVIISLGDNESIRVEADENVIKYIKTDIKENKLRVHVENGVQLKDCTKKVYVTYKKLNEIKASSGGSLKATESIAANNLDLSASSGGHLKLELNVENLEASVSSGGIMKLKGNSVNIDLSASSGGILKASDLNGESCDSDVSSGGILNIGEFASIDADASSGGILTYRGEPKEKDISKSSGGHVGRE